MRIPHRRLEPPALRPALALGLVVLLVLGTGGAARAEAQVKVTCVGEAQLRFTPVLTAQARDVFGSGEGSLACRVKPNDPQVFKGILLLGGGADNATCDAGRGNIATILIVTAPDGDVLGLYLDGWLQWGTRTFSWALNQNDENGYAIGGGSADGAFVLGLPSLCAPALGGSSKSATLAFVMTLKVVPDWLRY